MNSREKKQVIIKLMFIKKITKNILSRLNLSTYGNVNNKSILNAINLLRPFDLGHEFVRIGGSADGSYILPKITNEIEYCFSAGYGENCSFEKELENYNIKSFLADYNYDAPTELTNFQYEKKFIKSYTDDQSININSWIESSAPKDAKNMIMQMDIEGGEYELLHAITENNLNRFKVMVIELHHLHSVNNLVFHRYFVACLKKLKKYFEVFFLHPNNCCGVSNFNGIIFPKVLEITLVNKSAIKKKEKFDDTKKNLVIKNFLEKEMINLPDYWF